MMAILIETPRLLLKEMSQADVQNLFDLNRDLEVMRYTGDKSFNNINEALNYVENYQHIYQKYGYGRLSLFNKETNEYLGWCGLKYLDQKNETDLGYRLKKRFWEKGFATEAASACLKDGFSRLQLSQIFATAMKENIPSINIFKKLGLKYLKDQDCGCQPGVIYAITKQEWK
ncbi:MAG: GNAT family N-acetyltransferase [Janthinobacterium lividum]